LIEDTEKEDDLYTPTADPCPTNEIVLIPYQDEEKARVYRIEDVADMALRHHWGLSAHSHLRLYRGIPRYAGCDNEVYRTQEK
jgi:hypothetical protein